MIRVGLALLIAGWWAAAPAAQVRVVRHGDDRLAGIREVDVLVDAAGDGACAPMPEPLQQAAVDALRQRGLGATVSEKAPSAFHSVVITVRTLPAAAACVAVVASELEVPVDGVPEEDRYLPPGAWGSLLIGSMRLLWEHALVETPPAARHTRLDAAVRTQMTAIASRILAAQR